MNLNLSTDMLAPPPPRAFILENGLWLLQHHGRVNAGAALVLFLFASVFMLLAALYAHIIPAVLFFSENALNK